MVRNRETQSDYWRNYPDEEPYPKIEGGQRQTGLMLSQRVAGLGAAGLAFGAPQCARGWGEFPEVCPSAPSAQNSWRKGLLARPKLQRNLRTYVRKYVRTYVRKYQSDP